MGERLLRVSRRTLRVVAIAWLCLVAPLELATALVMLIGRPTPIGVPGAALVAARVAVVAAGLVVGRRLVQSADGLTRLAAGWAVADLGTLGLVLATGTLPSNRAPGDALVVWSAYALAAAVVLAATPRERRGTAGSSPAG